MAGALSTTTDANAGSQKQERNLGSPTLSGTVAPMNSKTYDVVVVGGGAAGLSAALVLGRARRRVTIVDGRNAKERSAAHMHGYLSRDGMRPADLLTIGRAEVRTTASSSSTIRWSISRSRTRRSRSRRASRSGWPGLLRGSATAAPRDRRRGRTARHPRCARALGRAFSTTARTVTAGRFAISRSECSEPGPGSVEHAQLLRQWSDDVAFFAHTYHITASERARRTRAGIPVIDGSSLDFQSSTIASMPCSSPTVAPSWRTAVFIRPNAPHTHRPHRRTGAARSTRKDSCRSTPQAEQACRRWWPATPPTHARR